MQRLRTPVPLWLLLLGILLTASITTGIVLGPRLLSRHPDFQIESPSAVTLLAGSTGTNFDVFVKSLNGFSGIVQIAAIPTSNLNASTYSGYHSNAILGTNDTVGVTVSTNVAGNHSMIVRGTSGELSHSVTLLVIAQDWTFSASPAPLIVPRGTRANTTITFKGVNGLYGSVGAEPRISCATLYCSLSYYPYPANLILPRGGTASITVTVGMNSNASVGDSWNIELILGTSKVGPKVIAW